MDTPLVQFFFSHPILGGLYIIFVLAAWFLLLAFNYGADGGQLGRGRWWVFECLWEDILMNIPGGAKRKAAVIRDIVGETSMGAFLGSRRTWTHEELRESKEFEACGQDMLGGPMSTLLQHLFFIVIAVAGPVLLCAFFLATILTCAWSGVIWLLQQSVSRAP